MDVHLLKKFYRGQCSEEEVQKVISWFSSKEEKEKLLEQLQSSWDELAHPEDEALIGHDSSKILKGIQSRIRQESVAVEASQKVRFLSINRFYSARIAAIIFLAVSLSFIMHILLHSIPAESNQLAVRQKPVVSEVPFGQRKTLTLSDSTRITLNAGSKISYPEEFLSDRREVNLEGEAFFEVAKDAARPFTVTTGEISTKVLGTSFNIRAYRDEQNIQVAVASGKVKVSQNYPAVDELFLLPGKAANYKAGEKSIKVTDFDSQQVLSWKEGMLYFKEASYQEVKMTLERWYGIEIQVKGDGKQEWQYSGSFQEESLENVLKSIGYVKQFSYTKTGNQVVLTFNR